MADKEHLRILQQGVDAWNQWRAEHPEIQPDLRGERIFWVKPSEEDLVDFVDLGDGLGRARLGRANFSKSRFDGADLSGADLSEANLWRADLTRTTFRQAKLWQANLSEANLRGAHFTGADLTEANLSGADLQGALFQGVDLGGANLSGAKVGWTVFGDVDFGGASGLETVRHRGPSTIGIDTIYASQSAIPEVFLRGAGVPGHLITYVASLVSQPIQFYSCFISYSTRDQEFAEQLHADLQDKAVRCWFAPEDVQGGRKLHEQIEQAIQHYDKLLLVLSENSMSSEWVKTEIYHARHAEVRSKRRKLFPISLVDFQTIRGWTAFDADTGKDMGREVREYFIPDFSNWKNHDAYEKAFDRLLRDLKAEDVRAS
jgi:uncharacterized protein YjbI with pentapeptide repeats